MLDSVLPAVSAVSACSLSAGQHHPLSPSAQTRSWKMSACVPFSDLTMHRRRPQSAPHYWAII